MPRKSDAREEEPDTDEGASASEWAVWIATGVLCAGAYARHGLVVALLYWLSTAALCALDPSLHSLQLLNLAAVVYDLSFELHRLYILVSNRPLLMVVILGVALAVEWLLERYEEEDAAHNPQRGGLSGVARLGRSLGRVLLPAIMGVLIACVGWLLLTALLFHPAALAAPLVEQFDGIVGAHSACTSTSDCIFISGSTHQRRVHGVYVRTARTCDSKAVYRQRGGEALYLHSPGHENQWNVGPDLCDNSPRNKWMEARHRHPPRPARPSTLRPVGPSRRGDARLSPPHHDPPPSPPSPAAPARPPSPAPLPAPARPTVLLRRRTRRRPRQRHVVRVHRRGWLDQELTGAPPRRPPRPAPAAPPPPFPSPALPPPTAAADARASASQVALHPCSRRDRGGSSTRPCVSMRGSSRDDAKYVQTTYTDGASGDDGCEGNGKPVYVSTRVDEEEGVAPYLYSPARRNSWLVGTDPCRANGWIEVRTVAERAEHIQAGASGPWQEYNGTGWVRSTTIRALPHCGTSADDCLYVSGSQHQQHTHGMYARTSLKCDGKPVYQQQSASAEVGGAPQLGGGRRSTRTGGAKGGDRGGGEPGDSRRLYLYSPTGRESWMVGRDACKPSGWLEIHSSAKLVEGIEGVWREHVPGGSWAPNPSIQVQLHALQDAFVGFNAPRSDGKIHDPDEVLWRFTSAMSAAIPPAVAFTDNAIKREAAAKLGVVLDTTDPSSAAAAAELAKLAVSPTPRKEAADFPEALEAKARKEAPKDEANLCIDLFVEPSLAGGRLLAIERSPSPARRRVAIALRKEGWQFRWVRPAHYRSVLVNLWLSKMAWEPARLAPLTLDGATRIPDGVGKPAALKSKVAERVGDESKLNATLLGLRGWRKPVFTTDDVEGVRQACAREGLHLPALHLVAADRQQLVSSDLLRLWPARVRLAVAAHRRALSLLAVFVVVACVAGARLLREHAKRAAAARSRREKAERKLAEAEAKARAKTEAAQAAALAKQRRDEEEAARREAKRAQAMEDRRRAEEERLRKEGEERAAREAREKARREAKRLEEQKAEQKAAEAAARRERRRRPRRRRLRRPRRRRRRSARRRRRSCARPKRRARRRRPRRRRGASSTRRKRGRRARRRRRRRGAMRRRARRRRRRSATKPRRSRRRAERRRRRSRPPPTRIRCLSPRASGAPPPPRRRPPPPSPPPPPPPPPSRSGRRRRRRPPRSRRRSRRSRRRRPPTARRARRRSARAPARSSRAGGAQRRRRRRATRRAPSAPSAVPPSAAARGRRPSASAPSAAAAPSAAPPAARRSAGRRSRTTRRWRSVRRSRCSAIRSTSISSTTTRRRQRRVRAARSTTASAAAAAAAAAAALLAGSAGAGGVIGSARPGAAAGSSPTMVPTSGGKAIPHELICPITHDLMRDPVLAADGHAYERVAIEDWFSRQLTSPITGERLDSAMLMPCVPLKNMAKAFRAGGT